jgi:hypothetical protein
MTNRQNLRPWLRTKPKWFLYTYVTALYALVAPLSLLVHLVDDVWPDFRKALKEVGEME